MNEETSMTFMDDGAEERKGLSWFAGCMAMDEHHCDA